MDQSAIEIESVGKQFKLFRRPADKILHVLGLERFLFWRDRARSHQDFWAVRDLSLSVGPGERLGIIGHNGAGKSTLLKLITGNLIPTEGRVVVNGGIQALLETGTGFHPDFTGLENARVALSYQGVSGRALEDKIDEIIDFAELDEFIYQPVKTYSAGMYARLAFSVATSIRPEVLVIDEILGAGDAYFAGKCVERMRNLTHDAGTTLILVSHDMSSIQRLCTRVVWMSRGKILMLGEPHVVVKAYIDFMQHENEIRLRAREMALSRKQARAILPEDGVHTRLLFRLLADRCQLRDGCAIGRISLSNEQGELAHIDVGDALDNAAEHASYIVEDKANTDWSDPELYQDSRVRYYRDCGGSDGHAPFVLSVPAHVWHAGGDFVLSVVHGPVEGASLPVEMWKENGYQTVGELCARGEGFRESVIPLRRKEHESAADDDRAFAEHTPRSTHPDAEVGKIRIIGVDFLVNGEKSRRVILLGSRLVVEVQFDAESTVIDPVFCVTFHGLDGVQMDHQNSKLLRVPVGEICGIGAARFEFSPFRLGPGDYMVTVSILEYLDLENWYSAPAAYDRHDRKYCITVANTQAHGKNLGVVLQEAKFSIACAGAPMSRPSTQVNRVRD